MYNIIQNRKIWLTISSILVAASIALWAVFGLNFGIDFTGGSLLEIKFLGDSPAIGAVQEAVSGLELGSLTVQPSAEGSVILRFQDTGEKKYQEVMTALNDLAKTSSSSKATEDKTEMMNGNNSGVQIETEGEGTVKVETESVDSDSLITPITIKGANNNVEKLRFDSIGPSIGQELKRKSIYAIFFVLVAIILYIAWVFRKVSKPVSSWKYGIIAIIALFHDVLITVGVFVILGKFFGVEVNTPFIVAVLTVLGYSVNDTIVVFDRIRENLPKSEEDFEETINTSVNQTISRSINTSVTTLLVLLSIVFFGGSTIRGFALALSIGVFVGTYSSIFLASSLLVVWEKIK